MVNKKDSDNDILSKALALKKLTYSDDFLFLLSVILYLDVFSILIIHHSIIDINTAHLSINNILKELTVSNIILFLLGFGFLYIIGFSLLNYLAVIIILRMTKSKKPIGFHKYDLLQYAIKNNNKIAFELYQENKKSYNNIYELYKLSLIVIFLSAIEIYFFLFTKKHCLLDILKKIPMFFHISGIDIYIIFIFLLIYFVYDITRSMFNDNFSYIYYNDEIKSRIELDIQNQKNQKNSAMNPNPVGSINSYSPTKKP